LKQAKVEGNTLDLAPCGQLERKHYEAVNKALVLLGGKWNRGAKKHLFDKPVSEVLAEALGEGEILDKKKEFQFFETPTALADHMAELLDAEPRQFILEPSAGRGNLVDAVVQKAGGDLDFCLIEIQHDLCEDLRKEYREFVVMEMDFLTAKSFGKGSQLFDRIIMNPPFTNGQDIAHVRHAYDYLKPGGKMVAILSPAWEFNTQKKFKEFRKWIESLVLDKITVEQLPAGTFSESGTEVRAVLIKIEKD
jgi:phospholipid N-methyltransferase